jgi:hypothetical protein
LSVIICLKLARKLFPYFASVYYPEALYKELVEEKFLSADKVRFVLTNFAAMG